VMFSDSCIIMILGLEPWPVCNCPFPQEAHNHEHGDQVCLPNEFDFKWCVGGMYRMSCEFVYCISCID
jgi:hypothetical protein